MLLETLMQNSVANDRALILDVLTRFADETVAEGLIELVQTNVGDELAQVVRALTYVETRPAVSIALHETLFKSLEHSAQVTRGLASGGPQVGELLSAWIDKSRATERLQRLVRVAVLWSSNQMEAEASATLRGVWRAISNAFSRADAPTKDVLIQQFAGLPEGAPIHCTELYDEVAEWVVARRARSARESVDALMVPGLTALHRVVQGGAEPRDDAVKASLLMILDDILAHSPSRAVQDASLRLLCTLSASTCALRVEQALQLPDADATAVAQLAAEQRHAAFVPVLSGLAKIAAWTPHAALALANVEGGAGVEALIALVRDPVLSRSTPLRPHLLRALAIGLREESIPSEVRADGWALLRAAADEGTRGLRLRAIARDPEVLTVALDWLSAKDVAVRRAAAFALYVSQRALAPGASWTPDGPLPDAIFQRSRAVLAQEVDNETARWLIYGLGCQTPLPLLLRDLGNPARRGAALYAAAVKLASADDLRVTGAQRLRRALVRATRSPNAKERAIAAYGRALIGDVRAWPALRRLVEDPDPHVQVAASRALQRLAHMSGDARVHRTRQLESLSRVRDKGAMRSFLRRPHIPASSDDSDRVLIIRAGSSTSVAPSIPTVVWTPEAFPVDVMTAEDGEILLPGLSPGVADVRFGVL